MRTEVIEIKNRWKKAGGGGSPAANLGPVLLHLFLAALAILLVAPVARAQALPTEVVQGYYTALGQAAATGDLNPLLDLFAEDATLTVPALTPTPVEGKEAIRTTMGGILALLQGLNITLDEVTGEGDQVTVRYTLSVASAGKPIPATDTFVIQNGKIRSLTITIAAEALAAMPTPSALPTTGGPVGSLLPGLLALGGAALVGLSRRFR